VSLQIGDDAAVARHADRALSFLAEKMKAGNLSEQVSAKELAFIKNQEPILRPLHVQLQRLQCGRLWRAFSKLEENVFIF
jgi:hypothetical protein